MQARRSLANLPQVAIKMGSGAGSPAAQVPAIPAAGRPSRQWLVNLGLFAGMIALVAAIIGIRLWLFWPAALP